MDISKKLMELMLQLNFLVTFITVIHCYGKKDQIILDTHTKNFTLTQNVFSKNCHHLATASFMCGNVITER